MTLLWSSGMIADFESVDGGSIPPRRTLLASATIIQIKTTDLMEHAPTAKPLLALPGPRWSLNRSDLEVDGKPIYINQFTTQDNTGTVLWDASFVLLKYFEKKVVTLNQTKRSNDSDDKTKVLIPFKRTVLELGSGTGLLGIGLSLLPSLVQRIIMSDKDDSIRNLRHNVQENQNMHNPSEMLPVIVHEMDWFNSKSSIEQLEQVIDLKSIDTIVLADCVWLAELVQPLVETVQNLLSHVSDDAVVYVCNELRSQRVHDLFFDSFRHNTRFSVREVSRSKMNRTYSSDKISIWKIRIHH